MQPLLTQLLNLPGIEVEDFHDLGEQIIIEVEATTEKATCPRCGQESCHLHQNHRDLARDLGSALMERIDETSAGARIHG